MNDNIQHVEMIKNSGKSPTTYPKSMKQIFCAQTLVNGSRMLMFKPPIVLVLHWINPFYSL